jgi:hypothetical protein
MGLDNEKLHRDFADKVDIIIDVHLQKMPYKKHMNMHNLEKLYSFHLVVQALTCSKAMRTEAHSSRQQ